MRPVRASMALPIACAALVTGCGSGSGAHVVATVGQTIGHVHLSQSVSRCESFREQVIPHAQGGGGVIYAAEPREAAVRKLLGSAAAHWSTDRSTTPVQLCRFRAVNPQALDRLQVTKWRGLYRGAAWVAGDGRWTPDRTIDWTD